MKKLLIVLLMLGVAFAAFGGGQSEGSGELPILRMGTMDSRIGLGLWYLMEENMDEAAGFRVETITVNFGAPMNEAFGAGRLDAGLIGTPAAVASAARYGCKIIAETTEGAGGLNLFARADSPEAQVKGANPRFPDVVGSAATLKGKDILYPVGSMAQLGVSAYLDTFGVTLEDVTSVNMGYGPGYQAFVSGEGDIVAVFSPANYTAMKAGYVKLANLYDLELPVRDVFVVHPDAWDDPELMGMIKKLLKMIYDVNDKLTADEELQMDTLVAFHKFHGNNSDRTMLPIEMKEMYLMTSKEAKANINTMGSSVVDTAKFYVEIGTLEPELVSKVEESIDTSILKEILK